MATSVIKTPEKQAIGTFTPESGVTANEFIVTQLGKTVWIKGYVVLSTAETLSNKKLGTISGVGLPSSVIRSLTGTSNLQIYYAYNPAYIALGTNGNINVTGTETNQKYVEINFTYLTSD